MPKCEIHPDVELVVLTYCPACRGAHGGQESAKSLTAEERKKRARKAIRARWRKAKAKKKDKM
jgi:hypothetical protein